MDKQTLLIAIVSFCISLWGSIIAALLFSIWLEIKRASDREEQRYSEFTQKMAASNDELARELARESDRRSSLSPFRARPH